MADVYITCYDVDALQTLGGVSIRVVNEITGVQQKGMTGVTGGAFILYDLPDGRYGIYALLSGWVIYVDSAPVDSVYLGVAGSSDQFIDIPMKRDTFTRGSFSVFVRDSDTNALISGASVKINRVDTNPAGFYLEGMTDVNGCCIFNSLFAGEYYVQSDKQYYDHNAETHVITSFPDNHTILLTLATTDMYVWVPAADGKVNYSYGVTSGEVREDQAGPITVIGGGSITCVATPDAEWLFSKWEVYGGTPGQLITMQLPVANPTATTLIYKPDVNAYTTLTIKALFKRPVITFPFPFYVDVIDSITHNRVPGARVTIHGLTDTQLLVQWTSVASTADFIDPVLWVPQFVLIEAIGYGTVTQSIVNYASHYLTIEIVAGAAVLPFPFYVTVLDNVTGNRIANATVTMEGAGVGEEYTVYTGVVNGEDARFPWGTITWTPVSVRAEKSGYVSSTSYLAGYTSATITIRLSPLTGLMSFPFSVLVSNSITAIPIPQAQVRMYGPDPSNETTIEYSGVGGQAAVFQNMPQWVPQSLTVSKAGYFSEAHSLIGYQGSIIYVFLVPTTQGLPFPFFVTVLDRSTGAPIPGALVRLSGSEPSNYIDAYVTVAEAEFNTAPVWAPTTLRASKPGYATATLSLVGYTSPSITVYLSTSAGQLKVECVDASVLGQPPMSDVTILAGVNIGYTDVDGAAYFDLPAGGCTVKAAKTGYLSMQRSITMPGETLVRFALIQSYVPGVFNEAAPLLDTMGILVIDPNGVRTAAPIGPLFFKLDSLQIEPGKTEKSGVFVGTINDNKNDSRQFDMTYMTPNSNYIRDNDEFWVGIQQGGVLPTDATGIYNTWTVENGGRKWLMGGWISDRVYKYEADGRITAVVTGKDYTDLWRSMPFGTQKKPRNYVVATDVVEIANTLVDDINAPVNPLQEPNYQFSKSSAFFPGVDDLSGVVWIREFRTETYYQVMSDICEATNYDWTIIPYPEGGALADPEGGSPAGTRQIMMFPRGSLLSPNTGLRVAYEVNVREAPKIQLGDTEDLATNILITGDDKTVPPNPGSWMVPGLWSDKDMASRKFGFDSYPPPSNPVMVDMDGLSSYDKWSDYTQIMDDEGNPALNFRRGELVSQNPEATGVNRVFNNFFSPWTDDTGNPQSAQMMLDLRGWRRLQFKFRHVTTGIAESIYKVRLHTRTTTDYDIVDWYRRSFVYRFGAGGQEANGLGLDTVNTQTWHDLNLLLPSIDDSGNVIDWYGWEPEYPQSGMSPYETADPFQIDFISFEIQCRELTIYLNRHGRNWLGYIPLNLDALIGARDIAINSPEMYFYRGEARTVEQIASGVSESEIVPFNPYPKVFISNYDLEGGEWVQVEGIYGDYAEGCNVRLTHPLRLEHLIADDPLTTVVEGPSYLWIPAEHSVSFSQIRFAKNKALNVDNRANMAVNLRYPYRYRTTSYSDAENTKDLLDRGRQELTELGIPKQFIEVTVDGDPRLLIGHLVQPQFDPGRETIFHNISMLIDDVTYIVDGTDFYCELSLGTVESRVKVFNAVKQQGQQADKVKQLESGKFSISGASGFGGGGGGVR